jgi:hypothetical protein
MGKSLFRLKAPLLRRASRKRQGLLIWVSAVLASLATGCAGPPAPSPEPSPHPAVVVAEHFTLNLAFTRVTLRVGTAFWVTASRPCSAVQGDVCPSQLVGLTSSDPKVVALVRSTASYGGLPAQEFAALSSGHATLVPTGVCIAGCSGGQFPSGGPAEFDLTVS